MAGQDYARMLSRGKSFEYSTWQEFVKYSNDCFKQDFVSFENALLVCKKTHISNVHNRPELIYEEKDDANLVIGCKSEYWEFVISGIKGEAGSQGERGPQGEQGIQGEKGDIGLQGEKGDTGVGITSVVQTITSSKDDDNNIITVTLSDGQTSTFTVKNGSKGSQGEKGADGAKGDKGDKGDKGESGNGNMEIGEGDPINNGYRNDVYLDLKSGTFYKYITDWKKVGKISIEDDVNLKWQDDD